MTTPYLTPPVFSWPAAPGGKLHCYLAGGTTPQATYSDAAGVTPNTNPVTLDSLGSAVVRLAVGVAYHFTLKDASDTTTLWDADNYDNAYLATGALTAAIVGTALYPQSATEISGGVTPSNYAYPPGDARRYATLQQAINGNVGGQVFFIAGTYALGSAAVGLTLPAGGVRLTGTARNGVILSYTGTGIAIDAYTNAPSNWCIEHLTINCTQDAATGIKAGNASQHQEIDDVAVTGSQLATNTGTGLELNSGSPGVFSGNLSARLFYTLGFKYGVHCIGVNLGTSTWTSFTFIHCFLLGRGAGIITGSRGFWMDALTNGVGSCYLGGTIEGFDTALWVDTGSYGLDFASDIEGNNANFGGGSVAGTLGATFTGRVKLTNSNGTSYEAAANGAANRWYQRQQLNGVIDEETYYGSRRTVYDDATGSAEWALYRGPAATSFITGTANPTKKFGIVMGIGADAAGGRNFLRLNGQTVHWDTQSPQTAGIGTWAIGDVCFNSSAAVGSPKGWTCTVAGSPGTWVSQGNL